MASRRRLPINRRQNLGSPQWTEFRLDLNGQPELPIPDHNNRRFVCRTRQP
jgi:hypothetical protein